MSGMTSPHVIPALMIILWKPVKQLGASWGSPHIGHIISSSIQTNQNGHIHAPSRQPPTRNLTPPPKPDHFFFRCQTDNPNSNSNPKPKLRPKTRQDTPSSQDQASPSPNHPIPSNKARPTLRDGNQSPIADDEGHLKDDLPEDVKRHNEEMEDRYDKPYNHMSDKGSPESKFEN
ncbi:uncharacterized protein N7446_002473 [Penicillium canescens]|uniref:uncharacterized protein n=1 Tax=Penicillium canescens TaxID=5083 RepID=UPI0026DFA8F4|nr:uncharacterized protein N7446_002473 [Penicillium canescens]KAJ6055746.1 hypothetical protein N7444_004844 [Penicillium canescens]KAJ6074696.1 hypothetical protein N7446_002473 [Penicillium canescens]